MVKEEKRDKSEKGVGRGSSDRKNGYWLTGARQFEREPTHAWMASKGCVLYFWYLAFLRDRQAASGSRSASPLFIVDGLRERSTHPAASGSVVSASTDAVSVQ